MFAKAIIELVALAVKSSWVGGNRDIFMSLFSASGLGFAAALKAKLVQEILFARVEDH